MMRILPKETPAVFVAIRHTMMVFMFVRYAIYFQTFLGVLIVCHRCLRFCRATIEVRHSSLRKSTRSSCGERLNIFT